MGANAQTTVPTFTASQVLTADQQNQSARTGVPVFATTGTRDAGFGGTGEKTLAEGQLCYVEGTGLQTYNGTSWITWGAAPSTGALVYLTGTSVNAVTSFSLPNSTFTATYRNYRVVVEGVASADNSAMTLRMRASGSDNTNATYLWTISSASNTATARLGGSSGATSFSIGQSGNTKLSYCFDVLAPQVTVNTALAGNFVGVQGNEFVTGSFGGTFYATTEFDALSIIIASGTTFTGTYRVYGYADS